MVSPRSCRGRFAVVDVETTGLGPQDRVVELACLVADADGTVVSAMDTLVDPGRGVGPTRVHGVTAEMVQGAPAFGGLARGLVHLLNGRVVVAHNLAFDWKVLRGEFRRVGQRLPVTSGGLCTAVLSRMVFGRGGSLAMACARAGIELRTPHRARGDAEATLRLLTVLMARVDALPWHRPVVLGRRLAALPAPAPPLARVAVPATCPHGDDAS